MVLSLVDTGSDFTLAIGHLLDQEGILWTAVPQAPTAPGALPGPVDSGVFVVPLHAGLTAADRAALRDRFEKSTTHLRVFGILDRAVDGDGDLDDDLDAIIDEFVDEVGAVDSPLTVRRLRRFVDHHLDELRADAVKMFLDSTADGYWIWNIADGLVEWSRRTYQILGRTPEDHPMTFEAFIDIVHPDDRHSVEIALQEHFVHGVAYRNVPMRLQTEYGGYRNLVAAGQVVRSPSGDPLLMVGAVTDRTAQLNAEQQAEEAQAKYVRLFQTMNDAAVLADPLTGRIVDVNEPAERLWVRPRSELVGAPQSILHPPDLEEDAEAREVFRRHIRALQEGNRATIQMPILRSDGVRVPVEISSSIFEIDGTQYILGLFRDISERLQTEQRLRERDTQLQLASRLAAMGSLAAGVGHEINNPLAYIMGNLHYVRDALETVDGVCPDLISAIDDAIDGSVRVRDIVTDLKTLTRGDESDESCDPVAVCEIAVRMANNELRHRAVVGLSADQCDRVAMSSSRLSQVAVNLLTNAAHAFENSDLGVNRVEIGLRTVGDVVHLTVKDNGSGISPEVLARVFEPFFTTKEVIGTGLGLSISRQLVEDAGGDIDIDTEVGWGTVVTVRIPLAADTPTPPDDLPAHDADAAPAAVDPADLPARPSVVIVDDDRKVADSLARTLGGDFAVTTFTDASEALDAVSSSDRGVDAIVCDLMMPGVHGAEFHARLVAADPAQASRVVFVTGGAVTSTAAAFERAMSDAGRLVYKPIDPDGLRAAIDRVAPVTAH